jgi:hypothetical protein
MAGKMAEFAGLVDLGLVLRERRENVEHGSMERAEISKSQAYDTPSTLDHC